LPKKTPRKNSKTILKKRTDNEYKRGFIKSQKPAADMITEAKPSTIKIVTPRRLNINRPFEHNQLIH
jgi:hypothetical protein